MGLRIVRAKQTVALERESARARAHATMVITVVQTACMHGGSRVTRCRITGVRVREAVAPTYRAHSRESEG